MTHTVRVAAYRDVRPWLELTASAGPVFDEMLDDPAYYDALLRNIARGTAFCVRTADKRAGAALLGGLMFSPGRAERPAHLIGWLAVATASRRSGIGTALVRHVLTALPTGADVGVVTFLEDDDEGPAARRFYENLGFVPAELAPGPEGRPRQIYRRVIP